MSSEQDRPAWQLPPGVSRGAWDYVTQPDIASSYDTFHTGTPLLELDRELVQSTAVAIESTLVDRIPVAIDLGCGTGRSLFPLAERGWRVVGVDLSQSMLECVAKKGSESLPKEKQIGLIRGNMAQLGFLADQCVDLALCLYSSLGMVQGRSHRQSMLTHVARSLRPGGRFVVHVHNRGIWVRDPGGIARALRDRWRSLRDPQWEYGDRVYAYRGLPSMYLHIYTERELRHDLRVAGLKVERLIRLNITSSDELRNGWFASGLRTGGYIAIARQD